MKRRQRKWTKGKLLEEPQRHPILALWDRPEVRNITRKRGEKGLHFNDMRFLLCKDFKEIKRLPKEWNIFLERTLRGMREYNDYTILQKDLAKLCDIGFLNKISRGYYIPAEKPVSQYIQDFTLSGASLICSTEECDVLATEAIEPTEEVKIGCKNLYGDVMNARALTFKSKVLSLWKGVDSSRLDIQQKIILRGELYPFTRNESLKRLIKKECLITTKKGKEAFNISPFRKRDATKLRKFIDLTNKYADQLGNYAVNYAMGMYSYPNIFTEGYITKKGTDFKDEMKPHAQKLQGLLLEFAKPCYVLLAPSQ